jgi:glycosyltransferase involved in cell wall biosynthesis
MPKSSSKTNLNITGIIIAKNEAEMIANCIDTLRWCDEVLVVDSGSTDATPEIAKTTGARVVVLKSGNFAELREFGLKHVKTDWVIYLDADERITPRLYQEIAVNIETNNADVLQMKRENICYGSTFHHGGWENDLVTRVFKKSALKGWTGIIHESPEFKGEVKLLFTSLIHLTHRSTQANLKKSADWTILEAKLLAESGVPPVTLRTLLRKGTMEFFRRAFMKQGRKDGMPGLIEALVQGMNRVMVYIQVWEIQQNPSIAEKYLKIEKDIAAQWQLSK